jgi:hypothetical protein
MIKCSPIVWAKFSASQKQWFNKFYDEFVAVDHYPVGLDGTTLKDRQLRHVLASNFAQLAVFVLNGTIKE